MTAESKDPANGSESHRMSVVATSPPTDAGTSGQHPYAATLVRSAMPGAGRIAKLLASILSGDLTTLKNVLLDEIGSHAPTRKAGGDSTQPTPRRPSSPQPAATTRVTSGIAKPATMCDAATNPNSLRYLMYYCEPERGLSLFSIAVIHQRTSILEFLLACLDKQDKPQVRGDTHPLERIDFEGFTALHHASYLGLAQEAQMLCEAGANACAQAATAQGGTCLTLAVRSGCVGAVRVLVEVGNAEMHAVDGMGWSAIALAVRLRHVSIVEYLLSRGAELRPTRTIPTSVSAQVRMAPNETAAMGHNDAMHQFRLGSDAAQTKHELEEWQAIAKLLAHSTALQSRTTVL